MTKRRILPLVWLTFSGGGVIAATFLPILALLFAFAIPLGWISVSHEHLEDLFGNLLVQLALLALIVPMLVHAAHRFRYTLYDGLQVQHKGLVALVCYGTAALVAMVATLVVLTGVELA